MVSLKVILVAGSVRLAAAPPRMDQKLGLLVCNWIDDVCLLILFELPCWSSEWILLLLCLLTFFRRL